MTNDALEKYYANLLIAQYITKPKAYATIQALAALGIINQLPQAVQYAFQIGSATGVQLDVIGKYVGVSRNGNGFFGPITLNDADFTALIKMGILTNNADASLATIQRLLATYFPGQLQVFDKLSMTLSYYIDSSTGSQQLVQLLVTEKLLPKPMGVAISSIIYAPGSFKFFGFQTYTLPPRNSSPFNTYTDYEMNRPWLNYSYAISNG